MDYSTINSAIATFGFPTVCCVGLALYIKKRDDQQIDDRKNEREMLLDAITYNRKINEELLSTNRILAGDIKEELIEIKGEIHHLKDNH